MSKTVLKGSLLLLLLAGLLYVSSTTIPIDFISGKLSSNVLAYPPPITPGVPQTNFEVYLPFILRYHPLTPRYTTSLYFDTVDPDVMVIQAQDLADQVVAMEGAQDSVVILDFCQPWEDNNDTEGVWLCDGGGYARTAYSDTEDSVEEAARSFAEAFYTRSAGSSDTLVMVIGTSNWGDYYVDTQSGIEWASMVNRVNTRLINQGYFYRVQAVGGSDMEIAWNSFAITSDWVDGYESMNVYPLYDFGDAQGCPAERSDFNGICDYGWYQSDVWNISNYLSREALPLIYNEIGTNAKQWYAISAYSFIFHGGPMPIYGSVTQHQACGDRGCSSGTDNEPYEGYNQLYYWLNQDPDTAYTPIWSTDFRHYYDMTH